MGYTSDETTVSTVISTLSTNGLTWTSTGTSTTTENSDSTYSSDLHGTYTQFLGTTPVTGYISTHLLSNETDTSVLAGTLSAVTGEWTYTGAKDVTQTGSYDNDITYDNIVYSVALTDGTLNGKLGTLQTSWSESDFTSHFVLGYDAVSEEDIWVLTSGSGTYANGQEEGESCDAFGTYAYEPESGSTETVQNMNGTINEYARNACGVGIRQTFAVVSGEWSETAAVELETSTERTFYEDKAEGEYESGDVSGDLGRMESSYYESRAVYEVTLNAQNAVIACTVGAANVVSINTSRRWLKGNGTLEIDPEANYSASSYNILPWSGNYREGEDSFYREVIRENYELDNPEDYLDDDFEVDWQFDTGTLQVTNKYRTQAAYSGTRDEWCDENHYWDYFYGEGFELPADSYTNTWNFENIYAEDSDILYALTESLLASSASGSGSGSGENSLSLDVLSGSATTLISNKVQTSTVWDDMDYSYTDDDGMAVSGTKDSTARYTYNRDMRITEKYVGSASVTPASGEFLDDGWLVRGSGKISETSSENGSYSGRASYDYSPDYYTYSSASGSYTESGDWRDNYSNKLTLTYKQSSDPAGDDYWHVKGTENGVSNESYKYSLSADQTFTWDVYSGTQNESGGGSYRANSHYEAVYDNEQSDEWTLTDGSGSATEDYRYHSALSASGSYSLSLENGSASIYGTSASNDSLTWHDRTEYKYSVVDGEWQTDMTGKITQTATSGSSYVGSGSGTGNTCGATSGSSWSASASEEGAFLQAEVTRIDWSFINGVYSASGHAHTDYDASGEYVYSGEDSFWWSESYSHSSGWNSFSDNSHNERESDETMVFHHERDEHYEWSLDETGRVYVSGYSYTQTGSMSANGHRGGVSLWNHEGSNYTHGDDWSSFYHSGDDRASDFYDDYDFTASWSESFDGVTEVYSSAHSASNAIEGDEYTLSGNFSDYLYTWSGQDPQSGGYSGSSPCSNPYASTTSSPGFNFTWSGWDVNCRQGVYIHNSPYSSIETLPHGLGNWSNPVETPSSAWPVTPDEPTPYTFPSQRYVDDIDDFFYGYDNSPLYAVGQQEYNQITVTNASGSASYSTQATFYAAFQGGDLGNEGVGSGLTMEQKQYVQESVEETGNEASDEGNNGNQKMPLLFEEFGFLAVDLRGIHEKLTESICRFYEVFKINKSEQDASQKAEKMIRDAIISAWKSGEKRAVEKVIENFSAYTDPPRINPPSLAPMIPAGQWQPIIAETPSATVRANVHLGTPHLQDGQIVIPDNHTGIEVGNFEGNSDLTVRVGANADVNLPYGVTNVGVGSFAEKKLENRNSTIILQGGIRLDCNPENHKKTGFLGITVDVEY